MNDFENNFIHRFATRNELLKYSTGNAPLYHHCSWWRAVEDGLKYRLLGIISEDSDPMMFVFYFELRKGPFKLIGSPLQGSMTPYQHPIILKPLCEIKKFDILKGQYDFLRKKGYSWIEWTFPEQNTALENFKSSIRAKSTDRNTFVLNIDGDINDMWMRMTSRQRNMVRKAEKTGVKIIQCKGTEEDITGFYKMLEGTFAKSGLVPPHPYSFYCNCIRNLTIEDRLLFLSARVNGENIAMGLFPYDEKEIHYMSGTSQTNIGKYAPNNLMQWKVIRFAVENNISVYDLGGSGIPSIDKFKANICSNQVSFPRVVWKSSCIDWTEKMYLRSKSFLNLLRVKKLKK
jgi:hypothetical protein